MNALTIQGIVNVLARVLLSAIFLLAAVGNKIPNFSGVVQYMAAAGVPAPELMLVGAIVFLVGGSLSVMLGFQARFGAALLGVFLILATYYFHPFWRLEGAAAMEQQIHFMKNLALFGAMLFVIANGSGSFSLDRVLFRRHERSAAQPVSYEEALSH